jgi:hypothetical protein
MRRSVPILFLAASLMALCAAPARGASAAECVQAEPSFGICALDARFEPQPGDTPMQAGSHPEAFSVELAVNSEEDPDGFQGGPEIVPTDEVKDLRIFSPPGLVGSPTAVAPCSAAQFILGGSVTQCPASTALGTARIEFQEVDYVQTVPVYNLLPAPGVAAKIGFVVENVAPVTVDLRLRPEPPHNVIAEVTNVTQVRYFFASLTTLWGVPADSSHDQERGKCAFTPAADSCEVDAAELPFLTLPTRCEGPLVTEAEADSWQDPGEWARASTESHDEAEPPNPLGPGGCDALDFSPTISARPTSRAASSPTGLDFSLDVEDPGIANPTGYAASQIRKVEVTLPRGMSANPSLAEGLEVCTEADLDRESAFSAPGAGCPEASKIGTVEVETPLLEEEVNGSLFIAEPYDNLAEDSLIALYVVIKNPKLGIVVTQALKVEPDPLTGQLITTTTEDVPQLPFSHFRLHFREGGRSPLISPPGCGSFKASATLTPWAGGPPLETSSAFEIVSGPSEGPCPSATAPFDPGFEAGTANNAAGRYSPFYLRLTRGDGEQDMTRFSSILPAGVVGKLAGVPYCPEAGIAQAASRTGPHGAREELDAPSCPQASKIGRTSAGAGVGSQLTYVPGSLYLAGPYKGAPISVVAITPAKAGPFDAGTVLVRQALDLNPVTAEVEVDGSASDPIPHILKGIPLNVRDLRVYVDRESFTLNATSCAEMATRATLWGGGTALLPLPDSPVGLAARYQAADCASLGFKPRLAIKLKGGTRRGAHPALKAVVTPRLGDANFSRAVVTLPRSAFLEQAHIRTICTRVQFAAGEGNGAGCPEGARYGYARAWSPLLDGPAVGPVFLRSSDNNLPDLVVALTGPPSAPFAFELSARIDSVRGGIRSIFAAIPDVPVSRFELRMQGGRKGLIVNSRRLCHKPGRNRARANLRGQNGRLSRTRPAVRAQGCAKQGKRRATQRRRDA